MSSITDTDYLHKKAYEADRVVAAVNESHEYFLSGDWEKAIKGIEKRLNS